MKKCSKCNSVKELTQFHVDKSRVDGRTSSCKFCRTKHSVNYAKQNKTWKSESAKRYNKKRMQSEEAKQKASHASTKWAKNNPTKSIPYNRANAALRRIQKRYANTKCAPIQQIISVYEQAYLMEVETGIHHQVDHKIPLQAGGSHTVDNLEILTEDAHREKTLAEYKLIENLLTKYYEDINNDETSSELQ